MRAELYIAQVIERDPGLRRRVCSVAEIPDYGDNNPVYTLEEFRGDEHLRALAGNLGCHSNEVFVTLRNHLARAMGVSTSCLPSLNAADVALLVSDRFIERTAAILNCPNESAEVISALFDREAVSQLAQRAGLAQPQEVASLASLLWRLISPDGIRVVCRYFGGQTDIWGVLTRLISPNAAEMIMRTFACRHAEIFSFLIGSESDDSDCNVNYAEAPSPSQASQKLDMLAVAVIRELLRIVADTYIADAEKSASQLAVHGRDNEGSLRSLLLYDARGSYRMALAAAVPGDHAVGDLICTEPQFLSECPYSADIEMRVAIESDPGASTSVQIDFSMPGDGSPPRPLMRITGLTAQQAIHLQKNLPKSAGALNGSGDTLRQRVLTSRIPALPTIERTTWQELSAFDDSLVQYFVLARRELPDEYGLRQAIKEVVDDAFSVLPDRQTVCLRREEILAHLTAEYRANSRSLKEI